MNVFSKIQMANVNLVKGSAIKNLSIRPDINEQSTTITIKSPLIDEDK